MLLKFAFSFNLRRYITVEALKAPLGHNEDKAGKKGKEGKNGKKSKTGKKAEKAGSRT